MPMRSLKNKGGIPIRTRPHWWAAAAKNSNAGEGYRVMSEVKALDRGHEPLPRVQEIPLRRNNAAHGNSGAWKDCDNSRL